MAAINEDRKNNKNVVIVIVPYPAQSHLNMFLNLSHLIISSSHNNIPVHYVTSTQHLNQLKLRHPDLITNNTNIDTGLIFRDFPMPSCDKIADVFKSVHHLTTPVSGLLRSLSAKYDKVVVIHDALMASVVEDVTGVPNAKAYTFHIVSTFSIFVNLWRVLKVFPYPWTVSVIQFAAGSVLVLFMWMFNLYKKPKVSNAQLLAILPLAVVHTLGNLFTNMSLGKVAVSFTHTIKAMEPFFSVLFSVMFMGERPTPWVVLSLIPIVGGVALASLTEASFNWAGFWSAMASNATNQSRNVLSKKLMVKKEESMDNITLFSIITIMSFLLLAPAALFMEGIKFTPAYLEAAGINVKQIYMRSLLAAICFHAYQQVSYMILQRVSPITHSVSNCVKRVVVIVSAVLFFRTPVSPINALGTGIGLAGVFLYSRVNRIKAKPKAA